MTERALLSSTVKAMQRKAESPLLWEAGSLRWPIFLSSDFDTHRSVPHRFDKRSSILRKRGNIRAGSPRFHPSPHSSSSKLPCYVSQLVPELPKRCFFSNACFWQEAFRWQSDDSHIGRSERIRRWYFFLSDGSFLICPSPHSFYPSPPKMYYKPRCLKNTQKIFSIWHEKSVEIHTRDSGAQIHILFFFCTSRYLFFDFNTEILLSV